MITVSFIIPVYNCKVYLPDCIDSIRGAGIHDYEILLIDDGSNDGSGKLCDELALEEPRIRVIHQKNSGVSSARNRGIREAKGEYILFVDADDTLLPFGDDALKYLEQNADMVIFGMSSQYYHKGRFVKEELLTVGEEKVFSRGLFAESFGELFNCNYLSPVWNKFLKRSVLIENGLSFDSRLTNFEDLAFTLYAVVNCKTVAALPQCHYLYRVDYDHDKTVERIAKIQDIMGNTDLIAEAFVEFERSALAAGAKVTRQIWECLLSVYFELFRVKMYTTKLADIRRYCRDFRNDRYIGICLEKTGLESAGQKRWYRWIETENASAIWLYVRYQRLRHFIAKNVKRITGWRLK
ncbi:glycosyltransferase family 2 protein [Anaerotignum sp.]